MKVKIEGILLKKIPYKDKHIIGHLLLRSGKKVSVLFYGGLPSAKGTRASSLELGYMLKVELQVSKKTQDIYRAKEWSLIWSGNFIRDDFRAFCLMCLILEVSEKIAYQDDLHDEHGDYDQEAIGPFNVLSNTLFNINKDLERKVHFPMRSLLIFLVKLSVKQGIFPTLGHCVYSGESIKKGDNVELIFEDGGFALAEHCQHRALTGRSESQELWRNIKIISTSTYADLFELEVNYYENVRLFFNYFCYHFHYLESDFRSFNSFFSK